MQFVLYQFIVKEMEFKSNEMLSITSFLATLSVI